MSYLNTLRFITSQPLTRNHKIESLIRFAKWQISSRLALGPILFEWVNGSKFIVRNGETGLTGNIYTGLHEFTDMGFLLHVLRPEDLFVDVGANSGAYTILACAAIGAKGIAIEPVPSTYERLVANIRINNIEGRATTLNVGLSNEECVIKFTNNLDTVNHAIVGDQEESDAIEVRVTSLDLALGNASPVVIKIDVEGYESLVIAGAEKTLQKESLHSVIMELNGSGDRYGVDESRIPQKMLEYGFKPFSYDPISRKLFCINGKNNTAGNTLFIRDEGVVLERIRTAEKISILGGII